MIEKLKMIKDHLIQMIKGGKSSILVKQHTNTNGQEAENVYDFIITDQDDICSSIHIDEEFYNDDSLINKKLVF